MKFFRKRNKLITHKKIFLTLSLHSKEPKQLRKTISELTRKDLAGIILVLKEIFSGSIQLNKDLHSLVKNRKAWKSLLQLYEEGKIDTLYDKTTLANYIVVIANLLECLY